MYTRTCAHAFARLRAPSLSVSLCLSLSHTRTHSLSHSLTLTHLLTHSLTHSHTHRYYRPFGVRAGFITFPANKRNDPARYLIVSDRKNEKMTGEAASKVVIPPLYQRFVNMKVALGRLQRIWYLWPQRQKTISFCRATLTFFLQHNTQTVSPEVYNIQLIRELVEDKWELKDLDVCMCVCVCVCLCV